MSVSSATVGASMAERNTNSVPTSATVTMFGLPHRWGVSTFHPRVPGEPERQNNGHRPADAAVHPGCGSSSLAYVAGAVGARSTISYAPYYQHHRPTYSQAPRSRLTSPQLA